MNKKILIITGISIVGTFAILFAIYKIKKNKELSKIK